MSLGGGNEDRDLFVVVTIGGLLIMGATTSDMSLVEGIRTGCDEPSGSNDLFPSPS